MTDLSFSQVPSQQVRKDLSYGLQNWKTAEENYKQANYFEALCNTIGYIDDIKGRQFANDPQNGIKISHGSVQVYITLKNDQLQVLAPFVNIEKAQKMVILRKVCEINFNGLTMARIEAREDTLCFIFSCPLAACEPWKIYDTLKEICWTADQYDDEFIIMHEAAWVYEPDTIPYSDLRKELAWKAFKLCLQEAKDWIAYLKPLGYTWIVWDVLYMTLLKIDHLCAPQGIVKNQLETNITRLFEKRDLNDIVNEGISHINSFDKLPQSAFFTQLYDVSTFIPSKISGSGTNVQTALKPFLDEAYTFLKKNEIISGYLCLQKAIFRMLHNYRFNKVQWDHLESLLAGNSMIPVKDAANKLYDELNEFYNNPRDLFIAPAPEKKEEKKNLLASWF